MRFEMLEWVKDLSAYGKLGYKRVVEPRLGKGVDYTDPKYKDADSRVLLKDAIERVRARGFAPFNVDLIVHAETHFAQQFGRNAVFSHWGRTSPGGLDPALRHVQAPVIELDDCTHETVLLKSQTGFELDPATFRREMEYAGRWRRISVDDQIKRLDVFRFALINQAVDHDRHSGRVIGPGIQVNTHHLAVIRIDLPITEQQAANNLPLMNLRFIRFRHWICGHRKCCAQRQHA